MDAAGKPPRWIMLLVLAGVGLPYVINLGASSIWDTNEAFYAETPREMIESGDYLAPKFNYEPRTQKPPLTYWLVLLSYRAFGVGEFALRLPGALAAIGCLFFTCRIGSLLFSGWAGLAAMAILGTTVRFFVLARRLPIDILLLFCLTGTAFFLVKSCRDGALRTWIGAWLFAGFGVLTKGPIAAVIPAAAVLAAALWTRKWRISVSRAASALLVQIAVAGPWYFLIYRRLGWDYIETFFLRDNLSRFALEYLGPARGPGYYFGVFFVDFFPWSILAVPALFAYLANRRASRDLQDSPYAFLLAWCLFVFVFFSLSKNKQEYYIAPIYPMLAVLMSGMMHKMNAAVEVARSERASRLWRWSFLLVSLALVGVSVSVLILLPAAIPDLSPLLTYLPAGAFFLASLIPAVVAVRARLSVGFGGLALSLWPLFLLAALVYLPAAEPYRPVRDLCSLIAAHAADGDDVGYYRVSVPSMVFYLQRPIFEEFDPDSMTARFRGPGRVFCLLSEQDHNHFVGQRDLILYVLERRKRLATNIRSLLNENARIAQELLLVSNRAASEAPASGGPDIP